MYKRIFTFLLAFAISAPLLAASGDNSPNPPSPGYSALVGPSWGIGVTSGFGSPWGSGLELSYLLTRKLDIQAGVGLSFAGLRYGAGTRFYFKKEGFTPFIGVALSRNNGAGAVQIAVNNEEGVYAVPAGTMVSPRAGLKLGIFKIIELHLTGGYGIPLSDTSPVHVSGMDTENLRDAAELFAPGGLEVSGSFFIRF